MLLSRLDIALSGFEIHIPKYLCAFILMLTDGNHFKWKQIYWHIKQIKYSSNNQQKGCMYHTSNSPHNNQY